MTEYRWHPLTPERWADFEQLFGRNGAYAGCWCMWFRQTGKEYEAGRGEPNRQAMCALVERGQVPGIILYRDGDPAGWVAVQPREALPRLERSRAAKRPDDTPVWSIVCFFVHRNHRGQGMTRRLLDAAIAHAAASGATLLEAYPKDLKELSPSTGAAYTGLLPVFLEAGFHEVARHAKGRPIVRLTLS